MKRRTGPGIAALMLLPASLVLAHHGYYGQYALDDRVDFSGTVVGIEWTNPHAFVRVRAEIAGAEAVYRIELRELRQLRENGWQGDELAIGETVRVVNAAPHLDEGTMLVCCARIYDQSGREYFTDPRIRDRNETRP